MKPIAGLVDHDWLSKLENEVSTWDKDQVLNAWDVLKARYRDIETKEARKALVKFNVGQRVQFRSSKYGAMIQGTIKTINLKTVSLDDCSDGRRWKVSPSHLSPSTEKVVGKTTVPDVTSQDSLELITTPKGVPEKSMILNRKDFSKREWAKLQGQAEMSKIFGDRRAIRGDECPDCKKFTVIQTSEKVGPEVARIDIRCLSVGCGYTDTDVMD